LHTHVGMPLAWLASVTNFNDEVSICEHNRLRYLFSYFLVMSLFTPVISSSFHSSLLHM
jgi:hypothetical protein